MEKSTRKLKLDSTTEMSFIELRAKVNAPLWLVTTASHQSSANYFDGGSAPNDEARASPHPSVF